MNIPEKILGIELVQLKLFRGECPDALSGLLERAALRHLADGELLLAPDEHNHFLFILLDGELRVELANHERTFVTRFQRGECVGELSVLDGGTTSAYVVAEGACRVLAIERELLWELIGRSRAVARNLFQLLAERIRENDNALSVSHQRQQEYARNARIDPLTGLYNRYWLDELLPRLLERSEHASDHDGELGLMMLDVDHFKEYNDRYGHLAGDEVLRLLGQLLQQGLRPGDAAIRYGGEEFVVLLPGTLNGELPKIARRLLERVATETREQLGEQGLPGVTVSVGVARHHRGEGRHEFIAAADAALYRAKHEGRNRACAAE